MPYQINGNQGIEDMKDIRDLSISFYLNVKAGYIDRDCTIDEMKGLNNSYLEQIEYLLTGV